MVKAVLIAGDDRCFLIELKEFQRFLRREAKIENIRLIKTAYLDTPTLKRKLQKELYNSPGEALLIVYCGHGETNYWRINDDKVFFYIDLCRMLFGRNGSTMIINDCCHAYSLASFFDERLSARVGLLAACPANRNEFRGFLEEVAMSWRQGKVFPARPSIFVKGKKQRQRKRWGTGIDHYFFKK